MSFSKFDLHPNLLRGVADLGFTEPTTIQHDGIPPALEGRDVLACAMTGSGKTAAFLLPILQRLMGQKRGTTRALAIAPTRELAAQIVEHFNDLARHTKLKAAAVYGGVGMGPQEKALRRGVDMIVACPGRLLDHMQYDYAHFRGLEVLVLDEVDRMLDMGFLPDIRRVLKQLPPRQQTLFFSATMPREIAKLSRQLMDDPVTLDVERPSAPAAGIDQAIFPVAQNLKSSLLLELLHRKEIDNALVFTRTKHRANRLAKFLDKNGIDCERIHGNRSQAQRTKALDGFKNGRHRVLVATDVASRGIDVEALSHVVNFDVPNVADDYIHRVGRTARAGATGEAFTFVAPQEKGDLHSIERKVGKSLPRRMLDGFDYGQRTEKLEIPVAERLAAHRERQAAGRAKKKTSGPGGNGRKRNGRGRGNKGQGQGQPAAQGGGGGRSRRSRGRRVFS